MSESQMNLALGEIKNKKYPILIRKPQDTKAKSQALAAVTKRIINSNTNQLQTSEI